MYNSDSSFGSSFIVEKLKKFYGNHFFYMFKPWNFSFTKTVKSLNDTPIVLDSSVVVPIGNGLGRLRYSPGRLQIASTSADDNDKIKSSTMGAGKIRLKGVDINYKPIISEISLRGQASFTTGQKYRAVNSAEVISAPILHVPGADLNPAAEVRLNDGIIDIGLGVNISGSLQNVHARIEAKAGKAEIGAYTLHREESIYITCVKVITTSDASGVINLWQTHSTVRNSGASELEYPIRRFTSAFNSNYNEIKFNEPIIIDSGTFYFSLSKLDKGSSISVYIEGFKTDGHTIYEIENPNISYSYTFKERNSDSTVRIPMTGKEILRKNTTRALKRNTFYTEKSLARNKKRKT